METLVIVAQHRNQIYRKSKAQFYDQFDISPSNGFKAINCRSFQSSFGILHSPARSVPSIGNTLYPKTSGCQSEPPKLRGKTNPISIRPKPSSKHFSFCDDLCFSELWAGPAYSNSPPPSSLPIPKISLRQKRSISLDPPGLKYSVVQKHETKSAPSSPVRVSNLSPYTDLFLSTASATDNLRRILNLDLEH